ncbi:LytTR family DNA-binding domain-containing protein [soil metagenome]
MAETNGVIRAVIADDEPPARRRIHALLDREPDIEVVAECRDGREAIATVREAAPDLLFLDIQMPEASGFEVLAALEPERMPAVIFVTAYDEFALKAFEVHALDYLLKPFDRERFQTALSRARAQLQRQRVGDADSRVLALLDDLRGPQQHFPQRIPVKSGGRVRFVEVEEIEYFEAEGNYVRVHAGGRSYLLREPLSALEARLDPRRFLRIHRGIIVQIPRIQELEPLFKGEYVVTLRGGAKVRSSRRYRSRLHEVLGMTS